jgi:hypothetical protein
LSRKWMQTRSFRSILDQFVGYHKIQQGPAFPAEFIGKGLRVP